MWKEIYTYYYIIDKICCNYIEVLISYRRKLNTLLILLSTYQVICEIGTLEVWMGIDKLENDNHILSLHIFV